MRTRISACAERISDVTPGNMGFGEGIERGRMGRRGGRPGERPDGPCGARGARVLGALVAYLTSKKTSRGQAKNRIGPGAGRKGDSAQTSSLLAEETDAPDAGRGMGERAAADAVRTGARAVAVGVAAAVGGPGEHRGGKTKTPLVPPDARPFREIYLLQNITPNPDFTKGIS